MRQRILIVEVNWIGDVIFSTPFIRAVRDAYPDSYIACLVHPRCIEVLEGNPCINEIIVYDEEGAHRGLFGKLKLIAQLTRKDFDVAFLLHRSFTKAFLTFMAGAKERIGYATKNRGMLLTTKAQEPAGELHKVEYFLGLARAAGITPKCASYEFYINDLHRSFVRDFLAKNGIGAGDTVMVICPGGNWDPKRWPKESFARLADMLTEKFNARVVISGTPKEAGLADEIRKKMSHEPVIACGRTTLKQLAALFEKAKVVIANDTGTMHLAVAMKANTIALFGPTSARLTGPYGPGNYQVISKQVECEVPCYDSSCTENRCMSAITVEDVVNAVERTVAVRS